MRRDRRPSARKSRARLELPVVVPVVTAGLLGIFWLAGSGGDFFLAAALGLIGAFAALAWLGGRLLEEWPGPRPGSIWPDLTVFGLTLWYVVAAGFGASPSRAVTGALTALMALVLYLLGRYLGALDKPQTPGWGALVWPAAFLAAVGVVLHALGLTPDARWLPPLTLFGTGDFVIPSPSAYLAHPGQPGWLAAAPMRLAATLLYPNAAAALFLAASPGALWLLARAWGASEAGAGKVGLPARPGPRALAAFVLVAAMALTLSRGAWLLGPVALLALGLGLPPQEAGYAVVAGAVAWLLALVFLPVYLPALASGGAAAGLAVAAVFGALAWVAGEALARPLGSRAAFLSRRGLGPAVVGALVLATALAGAIFPRSTKLMLRLTWPPVGGPELAAWAGRLRDAAAAMLGRPLLGSGPGGWTVVAPAFRSSSYVSLEPQNLLLKAGVEAGLPGILLTAAVLAGALVGLARLALSRRSGALTAAYLGVGLLAVHGLADYAAGYPPLHIYLFLLLGLAWGLGVRAVLGPERRPVAAVPTRWWPAVAAVLTIAAVVLAVASTGRLFEAVGEARLRAGRAEGAAASFERGARLNPSSAGAYWGMARAHLALTVPENVDTALPVLAAAGQALRLDPGNPVYQSFAGQLTLGYGFTDIGLRALERARELDPVARDHWENLIWGYTAVGQRLEQMGDRARAEAAYRRATRWAEETAAYFGTVERGRANLALGIAHLRLGEFAAAREAFERAIADPLTTAEAESWLDALGER